MAPVVAAYQAMRGVAFMTAVTFVVEIGDVRRFDNPRQLMAYLGLVPSESSMGERVKRAGITKAGNMRAPGPYRGCLDLSLPGPGEPDHPGAPRGVTKIGARDRLERSDPAARAIAD